MGKGWWARKGLIDGVVVLPSASSFLAGCAVLFWECARWFATSTWPGVTVQDGVNWLLHQAIRRDMLTKEPMTPYTGLNEFIGRALDSSLSASLIVGAIAWLLLSLATIHVMEKPR